MSTARKVLANTIVQVAGKVGVSMLGIITVKLVSSHLGTSGYGQYAQVYEFLGLFGILADLGLFTIAVREMARDESKISYVIGNILTVRVAGAALVMILAVITSYFIPKYEATLVPAGVTIASLGVFLSILQGTISSVLQVHLKMIQATLALVVGRILSLSYIIWAIYQFSNDPKLAFPHLMWSGVVGGVLMTGLTWWFVNKITPLRFRFDWQFWHSVVLKSLPYGLALVLNMVYFRLNSVLLFNLKGPIEAGLFAVPSKITEILTVVPIYFMNSVLPTMTRTVGDDIKTADTRKLQQIIQYCFNFLVAIGLPMVVGAVLLAYPLIFVVSSPDFLSRLPDGFYGSDIALQILIFALFFSFLNTLFGMILIARRKQNYLVVVSAVAVVISVVLNVITIPKYGLRGAAVTSVAAELAMLVLLYIITHRFMAYKINLAGAGKTLLSALMMGLMLWVLRDRLYILWGGFSILALLPLGALVYLGMMILTGGINKEMLAIIKKEPASRIE